MSPYSARGADSPFTTGRPLRHVLAVARSVPAAGRLLDVVALLDPDQVAVTFTVPPGSASESGVRPLLERAGVARLVPWRQAVRRRFALALAASPNGGLHRLRAPVLLMPHGAGHNRRVGSRPGDLDAASGLAASQLLRRRWWGGRRPVPAGIALSHGEQHERLRRSCAPAAERAVVVGDPAFDRMRAHTGRRERYRARLGVAPGQRLVVLSSTWNRGTVLGAQRDLVRRLLAELPVDEYQVALIAHPNVWHIEGGAWIELCFADERAAGLRLIPPDEGWRAALLAADAVIGDHGSVTYYAAALGLPVLLAAFDAAELDVRSPLRVFADRMPALDGERPLEPQLARAGAPDPSVLGLMIEHPGESAARLRAVMYDRLGLSEPAPPARYLPLPDPPEFRGGGTAWRVAAEVGPAEPGSRVALRRFPPGAATGRARRPLVVDAEDATVPRWQSADAWSRCHGGAEDSAAEWLVHTLAAWPRARVAVTATSAGHALLLDRGGTYLRLHSDAGVGADVLAAAAVAWHEAGHGWRPWRGGVRVLLGGAESLVTSTPPRPICRFSRIPSDGDRGTRGAIATRLAGPDSPGPAAGRHPSRCRTAAASRSMP